MFSKRSVANLLRLKNPWPALPRLCDVMDAEINHKKNIELLQWYSVILGLVIVNIVAAILIKLTDISTNQMLLFLTMAMPLVVGAIDTRLKNLDKKLYTMPLHEANRLEIQRAVLNRQ
jgi:hypothetical protein